MHKGILHSNLFYRFLIFYIILLLVPMLILGGIIYNSFVKILDNEVVNKNLSMLAQVKETVEEKMFELWKVSALIGESPDFNRVKVKASQLNQQMVIQRLGSHVFTNVFIDEILLYYRGDNIIYSSSGTYSPYNFINIIYNYKSWNEEDFYHDINSVASPVIRPADDVMMQFSSPNRYITYLLPLTYGSSTQNATIMFLINEKTVNRILHEIVRSHGGNVVILDQKGNIITCLEQNEYLNSEAFKEIAHNSENQLSTF